MKTLFLFPDLPQVTESDARDEDSRIPLLIGRPLAQDEAVCIHAYDPYDYGQDDVIVQAPNWESDWDEQTLGSVNEALAASPARVLDLKTWRKEHAV